MRIRSFAAVAVGTLLLGSTFTPDATASSGLPGAIRDGDPVGRIAAHAAADPALAAAISTDPTGSHIVAVWSTDSDNAAAVATAHGLDVTAHFEKVDTVIATGSGTQIASLQAARPDVHVELMEPKRATLDHAHDATGMSEVYANPANLPVYKDAQGRRLDGTGVTIAIVDSGIDVNHPMFNHELFGESKVLANYITSPFGVIAAASSTDEAGGHGTHVAGIAAGYPVETIDGIELQGAAPGAKLIVFDAGAGLNIYAAPAALEFILEHHDKPCVGANGWYSHPVSCPPIGVVNNSYGGGASEYRPDDVITRLSDAIVREGVVMVWAAGNDGGNGSDSRTNGDAQSPILGVISVANYHDGGIGNRNNKLSGSSSRGKKGDQRTYPDIAAPGSSILSACRVDLPVCKGFATLDPNYGSISGTSMASPYIAGVVAVLLQAHPDFTPADVERTLVNSAHQFTAGAAYENDNVNPGVTAKTSYDKGHGLVDIAAALRLAQN